jgi:DNA-binding HxlR family transcriptional regulator
MNKIQSAKSKTPFPRSACPITNALDIMGDKWTLLIIRDMFLGKRLYREMLQSPEGIATNILANRLLRLEQGQFISKRAYQSNPLRYEYYLTEKGRDLQPVLEALVKWGKKHIPDTVVFSESNND